MKALQKKDEKYIHLVEEIKNIIVENITLMREKVIEMKWKIGDAIYEYTQGGELSAEDLMALEEDVHIKERELQYCYAFRKKFPKLNLLWEQLPEGKNISWSKLIHNYIDFSIPKPFSPIIEKIDEWGITDWWKNQQNLKVLKITSPDKKLSLVVRLYKAPKVLDVKSQKLRDMLVEVVEYYIQLKKYNREELDNSFWGRNFKTAKHILDLAKYDVNKAKKAISWCNQEFKDRWTLETVVKKWADCFKQISPLDKYKK